MPVATEKNNFFTQNFRRPSLTTFINLHAKGFHSGHLTSWHGVGIHAKGFWYVSPYYNEENCGKAARQCAARKLLEQLDSAIKREPARNFIGELQQHLLESNPTAEVSRLYKIEDERLGEQSFRSRVILLPKANGDGRQPMPWSDEHVGKSGARQEAAKRALDELLVSPNFLLDVPLVIEAARRGGQVGSLDTRKYYLEYFSTLLLIVIFNITNVSITRACSSRPWYYLRVN